LVTVTSYPGIQSGAQQLPGYPVPCCEANDPADTRDTAIQRNRVTQSSNLASKQARANAPHPLPYKNPKINEIDPQLDRLVGYILCFG